jgi:hypothetical protein
MEEQEK